MGSGGVYRSAHAVAYRILEVAEVSLRRLAAFDVASLERVAGVGWPPPLVCWRPSAAEEPTEREQIQGPGDVYVLFGPWLRDLSQEDFHVLMLDTRHRVVREAMVTRGTLYVSLISPREMFRLAGLENDAVVIPVHNYLSGDPSPSPDDRAVTSRIVEAERTLGIPVLDHVIVGDGRYTSLAE